MPYKFAADTPTKPFSEAPNVVIDALHRMSWAAKVAVQDEPLKTLNEVLVLGYFEKQKIGVSAPDICDKYPVPLTHLM